MATLPTITQSGSRTLTGTVYDVDDARFADLSAINKQVVAGSQVWLQNNLGLGGANLATRRFDLAGSAVELALREYGSSALYYRVRVDGVYVTPIVNPTAGAGSVIYIKIDFGSYGLRTIDFELYSGQWGAGDRASSHGFAGVAGTDLILPTRRPSFGKLLVAGDSIPFGSTGTSQWKAFPRLLGDLLGCQEVAFDTVGGSGYVQTAGGTVNTLLTRVDTTKLYAADIALYCAGINDNPINGFSQNAVVTAAQATWDAYKTANPNCMLVVSNGLPTSPADSNIANVVTLQSWLLAAAQADSNVDHVVDTSSWMTTALAGIYMTGGAPHVNDNGAEYYAQKFAQAIKGYRATIRNR